MIIFTEYREVLTRDWFQLAHVERISHVSFWTGARGDVVDHATFGSLAAGVRTWVDAFIAVAVLAAGTVRIHHTLRLAGDPRVTEVLGQALAVRTSVVVIRALGVGAAR